MPLHHPLELAEAWAIVDNLSGGRVGISFASGWNPDDFAVCPDRYAQRHQILFQNIEILQKLWQGDSVSVTNGKGELTKVRIYPTPIQSQLPIWITAAGNPQTFIQAGKIGANLLTHLLDQGIEALAEKIALYRKTRAEHGHDPESGIVSLMLHTFVGETFDTVYELARAPYCNYLKSNLGLLQGLAQSRGYKIDTSALPEQDLDEFVNFLYDRFATCRGLIGTPASCMELLSQLDRIGVDEVACLLDFGPNKDLILAHLPYLNQLREMYKAQTPVESRSVQASVPDVTIAGTRSLPSNQSGSISDAVAFKAKPLFQNVTTLSVVRERCTKYVLGSEFYSQLHECGVDIDRSTQGIKQIWLGQNEVLAEITLPSSLDPQSDHPDKIQYALLEACQQVLQATVLDQIPNLNASFPYVPIGLKQFCTYQSLLPQVLYSYAVLKQSDDTLPNQITEIEGDIRIYSPSEELLAEVLGLRLQQMTTLAPPVKPSSLNIDLLYELKWQLQPLQVPESSPPVVQASPLEKNVGCWLIFADRQGIGRELAALLETQGESCVLVFEGNDPQVTLDRQPNDHYLDSQNPYAVKSFLQTYLNTPLKGIVYLWSADTTPVNDTTSMSLAQDQNLSSTCILQIAHELTQINSSISPVLWLVTVGAQVEGSETAPPEIAQSLTWGIGRALSLEIPHAWGGLVDLDPEFPSEMAARSLFKQLWYLDQENQIVLRGDRRYGLRLLPVHPFSQSSEPLTLKSDASYLITGGLGHLGLHAAQWMVEQGARYLVLMGRSQASASVQQVIAQLEQRGAQIEVIKADVCDRTQVTQLLERLQTTGSPLKGIFHAAGMVRHQPLQGLNLETSKFSLEPKILGTWNLHQLSRGIELDFFICTSSIASIWGAEGLVQYAAANHFLDMFAYYRRHLGLPGLTINIGALAEGGMHSHPEIADQIQDYATQLGLSYSPPQTLLRSIEPFLQKKTPQISMIDVDWRIFKELYEIRDRRTLLQEILKGRTLTSQPQSPLNRELLQKLEVSPQGLREQLLISYLQEEIAKVLNFKTNQHPDFTQGFTEIGMDSLMAVELRNRLEAGLGCSLPLTLMFEASNIKSLSHYIGHEVFHWHLKSLEGEEKPHNQLPTEASLSLNPEVKDLSEEALATLISDEFKSLMGESL